MLTELLSRLAAPAEFRIALPVVDSAIALGCGDGASRARGDAVVPISEVAPLGLAAVDVLPDLCTGLWRLRRRMIDPETDRPLEAMRKPFRHLESVWDTLAEAGVDIRDHTNEPVPEYGSLGLSVLAYQPIPGFERERVIETVKPSVYVGGRLLQMGQVIVGTPEKPSGAAFEGERT